MLELKDISVSYGPVGALHNLTINVAPGELVTILGANGAGKSTTLMTISGLVRPQSGSIHFSGTRIDTLRSHEIVKLGITQAPEGRRVFGPLTVRENLLLGAFTRSGHPREVEKRLDWIFTMFPRLKERKDQMSGTLSGGEQQMLAIGRALMAEPRLLLLDEPSLGLAPLIVKSIFKTIKDINQAGVTVILVEQNAKAALKLADRAYVLEVGHLRMEGPAQDLLDDPMVQKTYLGVS
ncbi:MAG: ABC transporter ATP-binding protein [Planctomycetota bacterium]|jgi:branched-chain amino acid transport system ATP-binding protein|nr:ABC transporter ATP-binding protein [Planctomycetota bacterium]